MYLITHTTNFCILYKISRKYKYKTLLISLQRNKFAYDICSRKTIYIRCYVHAYTDFNCTDLRHGRLAGTSVSCSKCTWFHSWRTSTPTVTFTGVPQPLQAVTLQGQVRLLPHSSSQVLPFDSWTGPTLRIKSRSSVYPSRGQPAFRSSQMVEL